MNKPVMYCPIYPKFYDSLKNRSLQITAVISPIILGEMPIFQCERNASASIKKLFNCGLNLSPYFNA